MERACTLGSRVQPALVAGLGGEGRERELSVPFSPGHLAFRVVGDAVQIATEMLGFQREHLS